MYVQKKLMARLEVDRSANQNWQTDLQAKIKNSYQQQVNFSVQNKQQAKRQPNQQQNLQNQLDAIKTFANLQQMNTTQQQQINAFIAAAMLNKNLLASSATSQHHLSSQIQAKTKTVQQQQQSKSTEHSLSRKRSHSDLDACSSSEEETFFYAKLRQAPSLGKYHLSKTVNCEEHNVDQNNNNGTNKQQFKSQQQQQETKPSNYDTLSNHSDEDELDGKKQSKRGRNYRKMMIEKRRRDRINNSLNELRCLVPAAFEKQGSAKLEKAEILQMTVDHLKQLQAKGFDAFSFEPAKFALDYHTIGFKECATEVERYLTTYENIEEPVKQRVISHLNGYSNEREQNLLKTGHLSLNLSNNLNHSNLSTSPNHNLNTGESTVTSTMGKIKNKTKSNNTKLPCSISSSPNSSLNSSTHCSPSSSPSSSLSSSESLNLNKFNLNLKQVNNLKESNKILEPKNSIQSDQLDSSQIYPPFALYKSKKINHSSNNASNILTKNDSSPLDKLSPDRSSWEQTALNAY